jgi:hypothetical protein
MQLYLGTIARDKVGFTWLQPARNDDNGYVGGMRGAVERNTMRYYPAIDAYVGSLDAPPGQQLDKRLQAWFDATEKYRQLHEVERDAYPRMGATRSSGKARRVERRGAVALSGVARRSWIAWQAVQKAVPGGAHRRSSMGSPQSSHSP